MNRPGPGEFSAQVGPARKIFGQSWPGPTRRNFWTESARPGLEPNGRDFKHCWGSHYGVYLSTQGNIDFPYYSYYFSPRIPDLVIVCIPAMQNLAKILLNPLNLAKKLKKILRNAFKCQDNRNDGIIIWYFTVDKRQRGDRLSPNWAVLYIFFLLEIKFPNFKA